jgi:hypothetical protein
VQGFRQLPFARIVPNLKRLGPLTPRVREALATIDLLAFEDLPSVSMLPVLLGPFAVSASSRV